MNEIPCPCPQHVDVWIHCKIHKRCVNVNRQRPKEALLSALHTCCAKNLRTKFVSRLLLSLFLPCCETSHLEIGWKPILGLSHESKKEQKNVKLSNNIGNDSSHKNGGYLLLTILAEAINASSLRRFCRDCSWFSVSPLHYYGERVEKSQSVSVLVSGRSTNW